MNTQEDIYYKCVETIYQQPKLLKAWLRDSPTVDLSTTVENPVGISPCGFDSHFRYTSRRSLVEYLTLKYQ